MKRQGAPIDELLTITPDPVTKAIFALSFFIASSFQPCLSVWVNHKAEKLFPKYINLADDCLILSSQALAREKYSL